MTATPGPRGRCGSARSERDGLEVRVNRAMQDTWATVVGTPRAVRDPELQRLVAAGLTVQRGRLYLAGYPQRWATAAGMETFSGEWWVNDVHLESSLPPSDPAWREDVLRQGVALIEQLLPAAGALVASCVQAVLSLQSSAVDPDPAIDPDIDFAVGALHIHQLLDVRDDFRGLCAEPGGQPLLVATVEPGA